MKCINKTVSILLCLVLVISLTSCSFKKDSYQTYDVYSSSLAYGLNKTEVNSNSIFFSKNICVTDGEDIATDTVDSQVAEGALVINTSNNNINYSQNIYEKLYPASTTKILTCYVALKYGDLEQTITVSTNAVQQANDSSVCGLSVGDKITLRNLLYGMMLRSGNDAAIAIAEGVSGNVNSFVDLMNQEALALGATNSHFVNPHGLHDDNHYTTVYDMYLIFQEAIKNQQFLTILQTSEYNAIYTDTNGNNVSKEWTSTNQYLSGAKKAPDGVNIIGGKTGTTGQAGYCLVCLSLNEKNENIISIVYHGDCRSNLYLLMDEILSKYGNV